MAKTFPRRLWPYLVTGTLLLFVWFTPPVYRLIDGPITVTHWHRTKGEVELTIEPGRPQWMQLDRISKHALNAIIVAEDARFYRHPGIDVVEIWHSLKTNVRRGRYARGGSTITQQVIKVAFLSREKSLIRKAREAWGALLLEMILDKTRILEWYINLVEFGDGVYGINEGCWHYFQTKPEQLTVDQAVHLALVLPSPNRWSKGLRQRDLTEFGHKRFAYILKRMRRARYITEAQWRQTLSQGNFGSPIHGYQEMIAQDQAEEQACKEQSQAEDCPNEEAVFWDPEWDSLSFPEEQNSPLPEPENVPE